MMPRRRQETADVMLDFLNRGAGVINHPGGTDGITLRHTVAFVGLTHSLETVKGSGEMTLKKRT